MRKKYTLTEEQKKLEKSFVQYEALQGIKRTKLKDYRLGSFFDYITTAGINIDELNVKEAQEFQTYLATLENENGEPHYATLTIKTIISHVTRFYNYLRHVGKVYSNPFLRIKKIKTEKKLPRNIPTEKVMDQMLHELSLFWKHKKVRHKRRCYKSHVMAELMYASGMRIGEVLELKPEDIDFKNKTVRVRSGKGGKERTAYLTEYAASVLHLYVEEMRDVIIINKESDRLFGIVDQTTVSATLRKDVELAAAQFGIDRFPSHNFRHTLGFHLLRRGCDLRFIQLILGHEDMNTTTIYTKVAKEDLKHELDKFHPRQFRRLEDERH